MIDLLLGTIPTYIFGWWIIGWELANLGNTQTHVDILLGRLNFREKMFATLICVTITMSAFLFAQKKSNENLIERSRLKSRPN